MSRDAVLIFSADSLAAALIGGSLELAGLTPHFSRNGETARAALLRVRPALVLIDCDHEETCSDSFVGPALMTGARAMLFRSRHTSRDMTAFASRLGLLTLEMPMKHEPFARLLHEALTH